MEKVFLLLIMYLEGIIVILFKCIVRGVKGISRGTNRWALPSYTIADVFRYTERATLANFFILNKVHKREIF